MPELWRDLRVGDCIRIACLPEKFSRPGYLLHEDTRQLYEHLIAERAVLTVARIDDWGMPWIEYVWHTDAGEEHHSLMVNHDSLERVSTS